MAEASHTYVHNIDPVRGHTLPVLGGWVEQATDVAHVRCPYVNLNVQAAHAALHMWSCTSRQRLFVLALLTSLRGASPLVGTAHPAHPRTPATHGMRMRMRSPSILRFKKVRFSSFLLQLYL